MKKRMYEKPSMKVFMLKQKPMLLAGSQVGATNTITPWANGDVTDEEQIYM